MFSKACEYGIKAAIFITVRSQEGIRVSLKDISKEINSPIAFTAKVLQKLSKKNIVSSIKGPTGGFEIDLEAAKDVKLSQIVYAIDGNSIYSNCGLGFNNCNEHKPCPVHNKFKLIRKDLKEMLEKTTLTELSQDINKGISFLKR